MLSNDTLKITMHSQINSAKMRFGHNFFDQALSKKLKNNSFNAGKVILCSRFR